LLYHYNNDRIKEKLRNGEVLISSDQWPIFLYQSYNYDQDDPWNGLLRSSILVAVRHVWHVSNLTNFALMQAFKHIFTSPSSVDQEPKATRSGNARIHGMKNVTTASITYIATQVTNWETRITKISFIAAGLLRFDFVSRLLEDRHRN
jgi:hypothetical protein